MTQLTVSCLNSLPVLMFFNKATNCYNSFVCENDEVLKREAARLKAMEHIEILNVGHAVIKRENDD